MSLERGIPPPGCRHSISDLMVSSGYFPFPLLGLGVVVGVVAVAAAFAVVVVFVVAAADAAVVGFVHVDDTVVLLLF